MHITDEFEFRKAFEQQHSTTPLTPGEAGMLVMQHDRDFYHRWRHYQSYKVDPGPTVVSKQASPSYAEILAEVDVEVRKSGHLRPDAFATALKAHQANHVMTSVTPVRS
jgi:hypothetical protein